jgi:hypothetical protein
MHDVKKKDKEQDRRAEGRKGRKQRSQRSSEQALQSERLCQVYFIYI